VREGERYEIRERGEREKEREWTEEKGNQIERGEK